MAKPSNPLQERLDQQRFEHAIRYMKNEARGIKKLSTTELARTNAYLSGSDEDPWRYEPVEIEIPGGERQQFNLISNPQSQAREIIGSTLSMAGNGDIVDAASYLYRQLVLAHLFKSANRRTAVAAVTWVLENNGFEVEADELLNIPVGNLRNVSEQNALSSNIKTLMSVHK